MWNASTDEAAIETLLSSCASKRWAEAVAAIRPVPSEDHLLDAANLAWATMQESDYLEAFDAHPRIGEQEATSASAQSNAWSKQEQISAAFAREETLRELTDLNRAYEASFGFTYIVCATGKSTEEMLLILKQRLKSDRASQLKEAAEQQRQITQIRLKKWLQA